VKSNKQKKKKLKVALVILKRKINHIEREQNRMLENEMWKKRLKKKTKQVSVNLVNPG